jgi:hypothetical protein
MATYVFEVKCMSGPGGEGEDRVAQVLMWGTGIVPFTTGRHRTGDVPLRMLRLNPTKGM